MCVVHFRFPHSLSFSHSHLFLLLVQLAFSKKMVVELELTEKIIQIFNECAKKASWYFIQKQNLECFVTEQL